MGSEIESFLQAKRDMDKLAQNIIDARDAGGNRLNKDQIQRMETELSALGKALGDATQIFVNKIKEGVAQSLQDLREEREDFAFDRSTRFMSEGDRNVAGMERRRDKDLELRKMQLESVGAAPEVVADTLKKIRDEYQLNIDAAKEASEYDKSFVGELENDLQNRMMNMKTVGQTFLDIMDGMEQALNSSLSEMIMTGKFKMADFIQSMRKLMADLTASYLSMLAKMAIQRTVGAIVGSIGGGAAGGASGLDAAAGNTGAASSTNVWFGNTGANGLVYNAGSQLAFAGGGAFTNGTVNRPTHFPIGLMGEAGPEAIMPLARDNAGRLGVRAAGGSSSISNNSITVTVNMVGEGSNDEGNETSNEKRAQMKAMHDTIKTVVVKTVADEMRKGGMLNRYRS
jgi:phage-related minor tail protein